MSVIASATISSTRDDQIILVLTRAGGGVGDPLIIISGAAAKFEIAGNNSGPSLGTCSAVEAVDLVTLLLTFSDARFRNRDAVLGYSGQPTTKITSAALDVLVDFDDLPVASASTRGSYFSTLKDALVWATRIGRTQLASFEAAADIDKAAAIVAAADDIDTVRYQGRRYDLSATQVREFPRVPYESVVSGPLSVVRVPGLPVQTGEIVWDWDPSANSGAGGAIVPPDVKTASILQANSILAGGRAGLLQSIADGLSSQATGSLAEAYRAGVKPNPVAEPAMRLLEKYRLKQGQLL